MAILASTILTEARTALLNDPTGAIYPDAPMFPVMNKVYRELQTKLSAYGIGTTKETSSAITVTAGTVFLGDGAGLPADLLYPKELNERRVGSTFWEPMDERNWEEINYIAGPVIGFWTWREDTIRFPPSTESRELLIRYIKTLGSITSGSSVIGILGAESWLAQRSAAVAAMTIGSNPSRAEALQRDIDRPGGIWDDLISTVLKRKQSIPVRRRRTRYRVP